MVQRARACIRHIGGARAWPAFGGSAKTSPHSSFVHSLFR
jgi:hypothetical protein